ncbi:MAG: hypothetical protein Kow00121_33850 [Elainellaceae cyanobacterium]
MTHHPFLESITPIIPAGQDVNQAVAFYQHQLGFTVLYLEGEPTTMAVVKRDGAEIILQQNDDRHLAEWTTFRIRVNQIEQLYEEFQNRDASIIHPNGQLQAKPWGTKEFAVLDPAGVCITFYEPNL